MFRKILNCPICSSGEHSRAYRSGSFVTCVHLRDTRARDDLSFTNRSFRSWSFQWCSLSVAITKENCIFGAVQTDMLRGLRSLPPSPPPLCLCGTSSYPPHMPPHATRHTPHVAQILLLVPSFPGKCGS